MRSRTTLVTAIVMGAIVMGAIAMGAWSAPAVANGGAYLEFDGTHHLVGDQVRGSVTVTVPERRLDLLDRGPFYGYLVPSGSTIVEGRAVPAGSIRVGTFEVGHRPGGAELSIAFTVPDVEGDYYDLGLCNEPCTVAGFAEPVSGMLSIVATAREAALLTDVSKSQAQVAGLRRELRKSTRGAEDEAAMAASTLAESESSRAALTEEVRSLEDELASARADADAASGRIEPWVAIVAAIIVAVAVGAVRLSRRRGARAPTGQPALGGPQPLSEPAEQVRPSRSAVGNAAANAGASGSPPNGASPARSARVADESAAATSSTE